MSYNPDYEGSKALPIEYITKELDNFAATGQDLSGRRFSRSPPRVPSVPSTAFEESGPPSPTAQLRDKESKELYKSIASEQFDTQIRDEKGRIRVARDKKILEQPNIVDLEEAAEANVKYRWIQQGIWQEQWETHLSKVWKHEQQDSGPRMGHKNAVEQRLVTSLQREHKRKLSDLKKEYYDVVRGAVSYQDRQSSRPCYQFVYQLCQEREWIKLGLSSQDQGQQTNLDQIAYETVKSRWIRDGIWDDDWISIPGTSWRHELPRKAPDPQGKYREEDERKIARLDRAERPARWYPMAPTAPLMRIKWEKELSPSTPTVEQKEAKDTTASRPRRAAALKAMKNMAKMARTTRA